LGERKALVFPVKISAQGGWRVGPCRERGWPQTKAPFQVIGIDFLGPISPISSKGNNCICVITDNFSKFVIAVSLPDQTAQTTAECIYKEVVFYALAFGDGV
jgi:hypothetical protein